MTFVREKRCRAEARTRSPPCLPAKLLPYIDLALWRYQQASVRQVEGIHEGLAAITIVGTDRNAEGVRPVGGPDPQRTNTSEGVGVVRDLEAAVRRLKGVCPPALKFFAGERARVLTGHIFGFLRCEARPVFDGLTFTDESHARRHWHCFRVSFEPRKR